MPLSLIARIAVVILVSGCAPGPTPYPARTPAALPPGATILAIETAPPQTPRAGEFDGCPSARMETVRVARDGERLAFLLLDTGADRPVLWPRGFSARLHQGRAELVAPDGTVLARDGDVIDGLGGAGPLPDPFVVCQVGTDGYGPSS